MSYGTGMGRNRNRNRNRNAAKGRDEALTAELTALHEAAAAPARRQYRPKPPDDVFFPVVPMLDMAFQLLAFFILTFKAPSAETHIDLHLPTTPAALPAAPLGQARPRASRAVDADLENDLLVRALADDLGDLKALRLGEAEVPDLAALGERLRRYTGLLGNRPLRIRLVADDRLRYEPAAQIIATCSAAGVASVRLAQPGLSPALPGLTGGAGPARGAGGPR
jgi:biopolymer transport protein ExbD